MSSFVPEPDHVRQLSRAAAFAELSQMLTAGELVERTLLGVAQCLKRHVDGVGDVSVSVLDESTARTVVFTGSTAMELDEAQYEVQAGPCLDAARLQRTVLVSTRAPTEHLQFCRRARGRGVTHIMSIGLSAPRGSAAGVNIYGSADQPFDDEARSLATAFANYASAAINAGVPDADSSGPLGWPAAFASRSAVDRAALTLMARSSCTREAAMAELLGLARSQGRSLAATARSIIEA